MGNNFVLLPMAKQEKLKTKAFYVLSHLVWYYSIAECTVGGHQFWWEMRCKC